MLRNQKYCHTDVVWMEHHNFFFFFLSFTFVFDGTFYEGGDSFSGKKYAVCIFWVKLVWVFFIPASFFHSLRLIFVTNLTSGYRVLTTFIDFELLRLYTFVVGSVPVTSVCLNRLNTFFFFFLIIILLLLCFPSSGSFRTDGSFGPTWSLLH